MGHKLLDKKYGWLKRVGNIFSSFRRVPRAVIAITAMPEPASRTTKAAPAEEVRLEQQVSAHAHSAQRAICRSGRRSRSLWRSVSGNPRPSKRSDAWWFRGTPQAERERQREARFVDTQAGSGRDACARPPRNTGSVSASPPKGTTRRTCSIRPARARAPSPCQVNCVDCRPSEQPYWVESLDRKNQMPAPGIRGHQSSPTGRYRFA